MLLQIAATNPEPGIVVLELSGRITLGRSCQELEWEVDRWVAKGEKGIIFNMANVDRVDSAGLGIIVLAAGKLKSAGGQLRMAQPSKAVAELLKLTSLETVLPTDPTVEAATQNLRRAAAAGG